MLRRNSARRQYAESSPRRTSSGGPGRESILQHALQPALFEALAHSNDVLTGHSDTAGDLRVRKTIGRVKHDARSLDGPLRSR
jgi:hypothetical protein